MKNKLFTTKFLEGEKVIVTDAPIVYIQIDEHIKCSYCGARYKSKNNCPNCGAPKPTLKLNRKNNI